MNIKVIVVLPNMNKILQTKIPYLLLLFGLLGCLFFFYTDKKPLRWLATFGWSIFIVAKIGQAFGSGKEKIFDFFSIFSKTGVLLITGALVLKGFLIIRQQDVYVAGTRAQGVAAIGQGIFLVILGAVLYIYAAKKIN